LKYLDLDFLTSSHKAFWTHSHLLQLQMAAIHSLFCLWQPATPYVAVSIHRHREQPLPFLVPGAFTKTKRGLPIVTWTTPITQQTAAAVSADNTTTVRRAEQTQNATTTMSIAQPTRNGGQEERERERRGKRKKLQRSHEHARRPNRPPTH